MTQYTVSEVFKLPEDDLRFYETMGIEAIVEKDDGTVCVSFTVARRHMNSRGACQGGAIYSICDIAAAAFGRVKKIPGVTLQGDVRFLRSAAEGSVLTATVIPMRVGKTIVSTEIVVRDENGRTIADSHQTAYRM